MLDATIEEQLHQDLTDNKSNKEERKGDNVITGVII